MLEKFKSFMLRLSRITGSRLTVLDPIRFRRHFSLGNPGDGAGRGGGGGGSIRSAGGGFGRMAVAKEEEYFYKKQREDLKRLGEKLSLSSSEYPSDELKKEATRLKREMDQLKRRLEIGEENESELLRKFVETERRAIEFLKEMSENKKEKS